MGVILSCEALSKKEIYQYLRLLYSKFSETYCYDCDVPLNHLNNNDLLNLILKKYNNLNIKIWSEIVVARKGNHKKDGP